MEIGLVELPVGGSPKKAGTADDGATGKDFLSALAAAAVAQSGAEEAGASAGGPGAGCSGKAGDGDPGRGTEGGTGGAAALGADPEPAA
ncbi:MAG: hypothetical protein HGA98_04195, partial [Deltaproteobacteria bacterium]|nr:hypothetical protein [Deltaproteobacteria bacterium]